MPFSSNPFQRFWPGADNKRAISPATSGSGGWGGPSGWGQLAKNGIETYPSLDDRRAGTNGDRIAWREILDNIRRGLTQVRAEPGFFWLAVIGGCQSVLQDRTLLGWERAGYTGHADRDRAGGRGSAAALIL